MIYKYNIREILEDYFSISKNLLYANNQKIVLNCTPNYLNCSSTCNSPHFEPNANRSELFKVWSTFNFGNCVVHLCSFFLSSRSLLNVLVDPFIFSLCFWGFGSYLLSLLWILHCCCCSLAQSSPTLCDPMGCSTPGFPVLHYLPEFAQIHVRWVGAAIQSSHPLSSPSHLALNLFQHQGLFQWVSSSHQVVKVLELRLQHQSFHWIFGVDFLWDWLVWSPWSPRDSQESSPAPQFETINSSALSLSYGPSLTCVHEYWKNQLLLIMVSTKDTFPKCPPGDDWNSPRLGSHLKCPGCSSHYECPQFSSVQFCRSVVSGSSQPHKSQHARPPCPTPTPRVYPNPCPSSHWCHPAISSSVVPFFSCPLSSPASGSFPMSQLFTSGGQSTGVSASASVIPMNTQDWSPLGWTGWISLQSKGLKSLHKSIPHFPLQSTFKRLS